MFDQDNPNTWQLVMRIDCQTKQETKIQSYGDFEFTLRKISIEELGYSVEAVVENYICKKQLPDAIIYSYDVHSKQYPEYKNVKDAFQEINVEINCTEEEFRERYGFWELSEFTVYERDGNQSTCSFPSGDDYYYGKYYTS